MKLLAGALFAVAVSGVCAQTDVGVLTPPPARFTGPRPVVVHGKNDPRVPITEAEQIVQKVRTNGTPVWYLVADNEGHGFARKANADFYFYSMVAIIERYLLGD